MTQKLEQFWIVWSPQGDRPPNYRHAYNWEAANEAKRLAALHPGKEFYVLRAEGVEKKWDVFYCDIPHHDLGDGIPF